MGEAAKNLEKMMGSTEHDAEGSDFVEAPVKAGHVDSEGVWLISYSDMMTLLMGFFALLLSMSTIDENKTAQVVENASEYFGGEYKEPLKDLSNRISKVVEELNLKDQIIITQDATHVGIELKGTLLFDSGSIELKPEAMAVIQKLLPPIIEVANSYFLLIEGYTDSAPIAHTLIASNWELSGLRASRVARLFEDNKFPRNKMTIVGWGDTRPKIKRVEGAELSQPEDRRVVVKVLKKPLL